MISKQLAAWPARKASWLSSAREWLDDRDPLPPRWSGMYDRADFMHPSRILRKLRSLAAWAPVIWEDVDWDHSYMYKLFHFKVRRMRECHQKGLHVESTETAMELLSAETCLLRLHKDSYEEGAWDAHFAAHPRDLSWIDLPDGMKQLRPMGEAERESFQRCLAMEDAARKADLAEFGRLFAECSQGWWE